LGFGFQNVADQDFHVSLLEKYITPDANGQSNIQLLKLLQSHFVRYVGAYKESWHDAIRHKDLGAFF
jgi:hypothetical protein